MPKFKVLVTDYEYKTLEYEERVVEKNGGLLLKNQCKTEEDVIKAAREADALLVQYAPIGRKVFEALPNLKAVGRYGVGVDVVDLQAATDHGVCVVNVPDYCEEEVSDQALALIMACARKIVLLNDDVKNGNWDFNVAKPIFRLRGKVLGLVGFGKIPRRLAKKAAAIGSEVIAYDPFVDEKLATQLDVKLVELNELMATSDFVSVHAPLTDNTRHMISTKELKLMKPSAYIINTARGPIIDEEALIEALKNKQLAGAGLDVTEKEPIEQNNPLLKMENVIITPHIAWYSEEAQVELQTKAAQGVVDVLKGKKPAYLVNKEVWEKISDKGEEK